MNNAETEIRRAHEVAIKQLEQTRESINVLRERERLLYLHIKDCEAAGRVVGIQFDPVEVPIKKLPDTGNVSDFTALYLQNCPMGVKSKEITAAYKEAFGRDLHPKTIGMTLYRLKEKGAADREGHVWRATPCAVGGGDV